MKLLTKELEKQFPKLYETEEVPLEEKKVIAKFFTPWTTWTLYAVEWDGQDLFWGLVDGQEKEWGYFSLRELKSIKGPWGLTIERDLYFGMPKMKDISALKGREASWCYE